MLTVLRLSRSLNWSINNELVKLIDGMFSPAISFLLTLRINPSLRGHRYTTAHL